jgi:hypothetical protein
VDIISSDVADATSNKGHGVTARRLTVRQMLRHMWKADNIKRLGDMLKTSHGNIGTILAVLQA